MELYVIIVGYFIGMLIWSRKNIIFNNIIFGTNNKIKGLRVGFSALIPASILVYILFSGNNILRLLFGLLIIIVGQIFIWIMFNEERKLILNTIKVQKLGYEVENHFRQMLRKKQTDTLIGIGGGVSTPISEMFMKIWIYKYGVGLPQIGISGDHTELLSKDREVEQ